MMAGGVVAAFSIVAMMAITTMDVGMRLTVGKATVWTLEISRYLLVAQIFFGLAYTLRERGHIRITFVVSRLPAKVQDWLKVITSTLFLAYTGILCYLTWSIFARSFELKTTSTTILDIIVWPFQLFIPLGLALISLLLIRNIYAEVRIALVSRRRPPQEEEAVI